MADVGPFFEKKFICPVCQMTFTSLAVRSSKIFIGERESDFHVIYRGISPVHYSIIVCPGCNYAASNNLFPNPFKPAMVTQLATALLRLPLNKEVDFCHERDLNTAFLSFKLAIRSAQLKNVDPGELAGLLLAAAWLARESGQNTAEATYIDEALKHYLQAYQKSSTHVGNLSDIQAAYLIGELYLRQNNYKEAINWFNIAIFHPSIKGNPALEKTARDRWGLARELSKSNPQTNMPADDHSAAIDKAPAEIKSASPTDIPIATPSPKVNRGKTMQMSLHLYHDQIDWLSQIVNREYSASKTLIGKEQIVSAILDVVKGKLDTNFPVGFSSEEELRNKLAALLDSK